MRTHGWFARMGHVLDYLYISGADKAAVLLVVAIIERQARLMRRS